MARIVSLGAALQDIYLIDRDDFVGSKIGNTSIFGKIEIGSKVDIDRVAYEVGGGGANSAISFARHGHESILFSTISHDVAGDAIIARLDTEGIDTSYLNYVRGGTGCSVVMLDAKSGERTILTHHGVSAKNSGLSPEDLTYIQPDWIYATTSGSNMSLLQDFFKKAHELGIKIMFNPGITELQDPKNLIKLLDNTDIVLVNKREAAKIVPGVIMTELLSRLSNYVPYAIITDGSMGGIATNGTDTYRFGIYEDIKVKDTTGAGDAFGSGFLAHLAAGHSFKESLVFGSANATSVVGKIGAQSGILTGHETLHLMPIQKI